MATIDIRREHNLGIERARKVVDAVAEKIREKIDITATWTDNTLSFQRTGASGKIDVTERDIRVQVDLSLPLRPLKGKIEGKVNEALDKELKA